jgi:ABC-type multidrug transport system ATPase subunit
MSEELLKSLMRLFALASDVNDLTHQSRIIVENYLTQELNAQLVERYLELYDQYIKEIHFREGGHQDGQDPLGKENVVEICSQINTVLQQQQKVVILIRLLEYILADQNISDHEREFLFTVGKTFRIPLSEYEDCLKFIEAEASSLPRTENFLIIESAAKPQDSGSKHLTRTNLGGQILIAKFTSVDMFAMRYLGKEDLYLNGQVLLPGRTYILTIGCSIRSAKMGPVYYSDVVNSFLERPEQERLVFKAADIVYRFRTGNIGVNPFSLSEQNGRLIGIMGGSGSGKSTLLNVLNGNYKPEKGHVTINGFDIYTQKERIKGVIGYVSQDDLLIEELTVFQNLYYNAKLIFGNKTDEEIKQLVSNTLVNLGLKDTAQLKVGSPLDKYISGGQRKRLNIALELIREPAVLFVDEPTSGLSSRDSQNIMDLLKELSLKGKLIFVVIHQPSSDVYKLFDGMVILDTGGYVIYQGNPIEAIKYFKRAAHYANADEEDPGGNVNPEIIFNIIDRKVLDEYGNLTHERKTLPAEWYQLYLDHIDKHIQILPDPKDPPAIDFSLASVINQFKIFISRDVLSKLTNRQYLLINMLEAPVLAFLLAYFVRYTPFSKNNPEYVFLENENIPAYMFMAVVVAIFIGLTVSAEEIIRDSKIRKRESFLNLNKGAYLLSKIAIMFTISAIQAITFIWVGNSILHVDGMFWNYFLVLFSASCFANVLGLNISASFNSAVTIYILIPFLIIPQLIFSGVIVKFQKLNPTISTHTKVPIIGEIMASRWAFEALAVVQFRDNNFEKHLYPFDKTLTHANYMKVYWLPKISAKLGLLENGYKDPERLGEMQEALDLVKKEIRKQNKRFDKIGYNDIENLEISSLNPSIFEELREWERIQKNFYNKLYNVTQDERDALISKLQKTGNIDFTEAKNRFRNQSLSDLVTNKAELQHILEINGKLIAQENPIYRDGDAFRAHFFAPRKYIFGKYWDTFMVNVLVIWSMTLVLIVALFTNALRKILNLFGS